MLSMKLLAKLAFGEFKGILKEMFESRENGSYYTSNKLLITFAHDSAFFGQKDCNVIPSQSNDPFKNVYYVDWCDIMFNNSSALFSNYSSENTYLNNSMIASNEHSNVIDDHNTNTINNKRKQATIEVSCNDDAAITIPGHQMSCSLKDHESKDTTLTNDMYKKKEFIMMNDESIKICAKCILNELVENTYACHELSDVEYSDLIFKDVDIGEMIVLISGLGKKIGRDNLIKMLMCDCSLGIYIFGCCCYELRLV